MFQIMVNCSPVDPSASTDLDYTKNFLNPSYEQLFAFFKDCVDKNLIINLVQVDPSMTSDFCGYYSTTLENAHAFQQVVEDMSADFSLKKFWHDCGLALTVTITEIDFESLTDNLHTLINVDQGDLWDLSFPID
jgi:hypothetical protein